MDTLAFFGIEAIPAQRVISYPVSIQSATGGDRYAEIAALGVYLPSLPRMPVEMTGWSGVNHLLTLHHQAAKWTAIKPDVAKKAAFVWKSAVQRDQNLFLRAVDTLHALREAGSTFSPLLWNWWRITKQLEEGYSGLAFASVWHPKILNSKRMRRWYYEEVNADHIARRSVWPNEAGLLLDMVRQFEDEATRIASTYKQSELWQNSYSRNYESSLLTARACKEQATARIRERAEKHDLGVWLSYDVIEYLGLSQVSAQLVRQGLPKGPILRKKAAR